MKILVAVADYSKPNEKTSHFFVQVRNIYYKEKGVDVSVLNFSAKEDYIVDGIQVYCLKSFEKNKSTEKYDLLVSHQANIKSHYFFLKKYEKYFPKLVFIFHGHEVLNVNKVYSKPYPYVRKKSLPFRIFQEFYDYVKLSMWGKYYPELAYKSRFVFVSKWMYNEFIKWTKIDPEIIKDCYNITYNSIGKLFETIEYSEKEEKEYDFITIRGNLDGSKYSIDLINEIAGANPDMKFLVVGKGDFFNHHKKADNIQWLNSYLNHDEIIHYLNKSKCALMPTRTDAQGLMMCEMATFGIPLITSDIPVCMEIFEGFENVAFIDNHNPTRGIKDKFSTLINNGPYKKEEKYFAKQTCEKELILFEELVNLN